MPQVAEAQNSSLHSLIGDIPHYIIFGQDNRLPSSVLLLMEEHVNNFDDWVRPRILDFQKTQTNSRKHKGVSEHNN